VKRYSPVSQFENSSFLFSTTYNLS